MAAPPGIELQQHPRAGNSTQPHSGEFSSNAATAQNSLDIETSYATTNNDLKSNGMTATDKEIGAWPMKPSPTTEGPRTPDPETPSWPFQEDHQPRAQLPSRPKTRSPSHLSEVLQHWFLEIVTVVVAVLLITAIIILLAYYDRKTMPEWPFDISLSTAINLLSTFLRAALLAAVAEIVGQIKWTWFTERTRPLHHLQDFDSASRSVLGSLRLLAVVMWNFGWTSAGLLGIGAAVVTIASLAVGPFTQQALKTTMCPTLLPNARAEIPTANYAPGRSSYYRIGAGSFELEIDMKGAMIQGLTNPDGKDNEVEVSCASSNCTWEDYGTGTTHASIGLCSACLDTTEFVSGPNKGGNLTLPDSDAYIRYGPGSQYMWVGYSNLTWASDLFSEDFAAAAGVAISNFSMLLSSTSPCTPRPNSGFYDCPHKVSQSDNDYYDGLGDYIAASCILYPCMKEYRGSYRGSKYTEEIVRTQPALPNKQETTEYTYTYNYTAVRTPCILDDGDYFTDTSNTTLASHVMNASTWYMPNNMSTAPHIPGRTWANITLTNQLDNTEFNTSVPNACLYKMSGTYASAMSSQMSTTFFGGCSYDNSQAGHINCGDSWWLAPLWGEMNATFASLEGAIDDFATTVTNKLRMTGNGPDVKIGDTPKRSSTLGLVYETSTCTYFDQRWVSLPIILVLLCAVLLLWIIVKNYTDPDQPVWKGSVLPLMFFGLHGPGGPAHNARDGDALDRSATFVRNNGRAAPELGRIQDEAGRMWVRFHGGKDPGFVDLGSSKNYRDPEASASSLLADQGQPKR